MVSLDSSYKSDQKKGRRSSLKPKSKRKWEMEEDEEIMVTTPNVKDYRQLLDNFQKTTRNAKVTSALQETQYDSSSVAGRHSRQKKSALSHVFTAAAKEASIEMPGGINNWFSNGLVGQKV